MIVTIYRILLLLVSKIIKTDDIGEKFPVSLKAMVFDNKRILLLKNERDEWDLPGGKINFKDETPIDCIKREVFEETKLSISNLELVEFLKIKINNVQICIVLYKAEILSNNAVELSFEHNDFSFFNISNINEINLPEEYKKIIKQLA